MTQIMVNEELVKRLKELEEENDRLKKISKSSPKNILVVKEGEYMGRPVLTFEGKSRPFTLGLTKLCIIKEAWPQIERFIKDKTENDINLQDDDIKI